MKRFVDQQNESTLGLYIRLTLSLCLLIGIGCFAWWFSPAGSDLSQLFKAILIAQPLVIIANLLQALRHQILIAVKNTAYSSYLTAVVLAVGLNLVVPARLSELIKVTYLKHVAQIPASIAFSALAVERLADLVFVVLLAISLPVALSTGMNLALPLFVGFGVVVLLLLHRHLIKLVAFLPFDGLRKFVRDTINAFRHRLVSFRFLGAILIGILSMLAGWASVHIFLALATNIEISIWASLTVFLAGVLGGGLALLPGAIGSYHAAVSAALVGFGFEVDQALTLSIGLHIVQYAFMTPVALIIASNRSLGLKYALRETHAILRKNS